MPRLRPTSSSFQPKRTAVGCDSILTVELSDVDITPGAVYGVEICANGECVAATAAIGSVHP